MNTEQLTDFLKTVGKLENQIEASMAVLSLCTEAIDSIKQTYLARDNENKIAPAEIVSMCVDAYGSDSYAIKSRSRKRHDVNARHFAIKLLKDYDSYLTVGHLSLKQIGLIFGARDHSTVIHSLESSQNLIETDDHMRATYEGLCARIELKVNGQ